MPREHVANSPCTDGDLSRFLKQQINFLLFTFIICICLNLFVFWILFMLHKNLKESCYELVLGIEEKQCKSKPKCAQGWFRCDKR